MNASPASSALPRQRNEQLRAGDIALLLKLHKDGLTQVQIAQRLECDQKTVSNWLKRLEDTTELADSYLRGKAFEMAKTIAHKGKPDVQLKALQGLGVANHDTGDRRIQVMVGLTLPGLPVTGQSPQTIDVQALSRLTESSLSEPNGERK